MQTQATSTTLVLVALCLAATTLRAANTLELPADLDGTVSHTYDSLDQEIMDFVDVSAVDFQANFATYDDMHANLTAPPGQVIHVDLPSGETGSLYIALNWYDRSVGQGSVQGHALPTQFLDVVGTPNLTLESETVHTRIIGAQVSIQQLFSFTAPFTFRGWDATLAGTFLPDAVMNYETAVAYMIFSYPSPADAGQFVRILSDSPAKLLYDSTTGELTLDSQGNVLNGFAIGSTDDEFNGLANLPAGFQFNDNETDLISCQLGNTLTGTHDFGVVVSDRGQLWNAGAGQWEVNDWDFTYTVDGVAGISTGDIEIASFLPGDTNRDGDVDAWDIQWILGANSYENGGGWSWDEGDFDGNGLVNSADIQMILDHGQYGQRVAQALHAVPEPAALALLVLGATAVVGRRRKR